MPPKNLKICILFFILVSNLYFVHADWPMTGANPERTSWCSEEVRGRLYPLWYRPIEPYINYKVQVIAANGMLFISTARGLYALNAENGNVVWIYPTELPLGNSPTVSGNIIYVGGYDRKVHAINATTGEAIPGWASYEAEAGFETNPLVINGSIYAGNRDGYFYALDATTGSLKWRYKTDGPILFSAAYKDSVLFFASNDSYAYALNTNGNLVWKSKKLPGAGFHSFWPVIYNDCVIFAGSENYSNEKSNTGIGAGTMPNGLERPEFYGDPLNIPDGELIGQLGTETGDWVEGTETIDAHVITEYFEKKPWRRTYFVLNRFTGEELTFDSDQDGNPEYAPIAWYGTQNGNRYPPVIGSDGVLYQPNNYMSNQYIARGGISGWKFKTQYISRISHKRFAVDEPMAASAGGNVVYYSLCCDRSAGGIDISTTITQSDRMWIYYDHNLGSGTIPSDDYHPKYPGAYNTAFGNWMSYSAAIYANHGMPQNPPIPYNGKIFIQQGNCILAFSASGKATAALPTAATVDITEKTPSISNTTLKQRLEGEVQKIIDAGHLRPGHHSCGFTDAKLSNPEDAKIFYMTHYFSNPADIHYYLLRALPHLSSTLQQKVLNYLPNEFVKYPPCNTLHIGWKDGAPREIFDPPPEVANKMAAFASIPLSDISRFKQTIPLPCYYYGFYGLWKYAKQFGNADTIFAAIKNNHPQIPGHDSIFTDYPWILNAYIAGYIGYIEIGKLAGFSEDSDAIRNFVAERNRLLALRANIFSKDFLFAGDRKNFYNVFNVSRNFIYLVPELADYLHDNALAKVKEAVEEYNKTAPCWFVSKYDATRDEGTLHFLYDYHSIFQAKALILKESPEELTKYIDVPAFYRGDLFYIDNLVSLLEATETSIGTPQKKKIINCLHLQFSIDALPGNKIGFQMVLPVGGEYKLAVYDMSGKLILQHNGNKNSPGMHQINCIDSKMVNGSYLVSLTQGTSQTWKKFVKSL